MASSRNNSSKTKRNNIYRRNISSQKKINRVCEARKKAPNKKLNLLVKQGNKLHTSLIRPANIEKSQSYIADLYDDGRDQRVEDSNEYFLYQCNVRRSPRLKIGHNQVNFSCHRTPDDVSIKQDIASTIVHSTNAKEQDKSKGKRILIGHEQCRSLVVNGDVTPSILTTKDQNVAYVTPVLRRSPWLKNFKMTWLQVAIESVISMHNTLYQEHMKGKKPNVRSRRVSPVNKVMRTNCVKTIGETDLSSFDLGIDSQSNTQCPLVDNGLVLMEVDIKTIDATVQLKMVELGSIVDMVNKGELRLSNKRRSGTQKQVCTEIFAIEPDYGSPINILDDGMVFSEDDFKKIDESEIVPRYLVVNIYGILYRADDEDGEWKRGSGVDLSGGSGGLGRFYGWSSSRIVVVSRASSGKDRHNKALTLVKKSSPFFFLAAHLDCWCKFSRTSNEMIDSTKIGLTHTVDDHQKDDEHGEQKRDGRADLSGDGSGRLDCTLKTPKVAR
ncbi:Uncharacterized protein Fot_10938 [Forsythia ovata]|uniref:Uncharacterized protein n=1 Tax=Forsythia ovata TaxID=205694 RepID=A0ABD1WL27_9LAMI